jgi:EmrB/QacA subfamily drug resistance transporter
MTTDGTGQPDGSLVASSSAGPEPGAPTALTHRQILVIIGGLIAGMLLAALDMTIVSTSIRTIADDLDGLSIQAWVTTAYLITSTISTPLYGKLSDLYGRRPYFMLAISVFLVGSALSGLAQNMYELAAFRAIQGLGAGGLFSLALAIVGDIVPPRERARYQGYFMAVFGTSSVLGPVVGGFFAGSDTLLGITGWRWVFLINVPIGLVALAVVAKVLHIPHTRRDHRIDWPGALTLIVGVVPLLLVAEQGREWGWLSAGSIACYVITVISLSLFVRIERGYGDDALLPLRLFRGRTFSIGVSLNAIVGMGMFGGIAVLPLYMQIVQGYSPTESGLLLLPMSAGIMSASLFAGQMVGRTGRYKVYPVVGGVLLVVGMSLFTQFDLTTPLWHVFAASIVFGAGLGLNMQMLIMAIQNSVPPQDIGVSTSAAMFFRQMGGTLGTAVFLSVLFGTVAGNIAEQFRAAGVAPPSTGLSIDDTSYLDSLPAAVANPIRTGFADSMDLVFLIGAAVLVVGMITVWFLPEEPLRTLSGLDARQAQTDEAAAAAAATTAAPATPGEPAVPTARSSHDSGAGTR